MKDLYLLQGTSTVLHVGTAVNDIFDAKGYLAEVTRVTFAKPGGARDAIFALQVSGTDAKFCWGKDGGTGTPTATGGFFVKPATRLWEEFTARVVDIKEQLTETGPQVVVYLDLIPGN